MARHGVPDHGPNRSHPDTVTRGAETRDWLNAEAAAGRPAGEDEAWGFITSRWPSIPTHHAEHVLNLAMDAPGPGMGGPR